MANRGLTISIPIWVRVPVIIALVLVGVLISPMLLDAAGVASRSGDGGGHGSGNEMEMDGSGHGSRDDRQTDGGDHGRSGDGSGHGSGDERVRSDHNQGRRGPAAPSEPGLAAGAAQVVSFTIDDIPIEGVRVGGRA